MKKFIAAAFCLFFCMRTMAQQPPLQAPPLVTDSGRHAPPDTAAKKNDVPPPVPEAGAKPVSRKWYQKLFPPKKPITITFDETGRMIGFPPAVLRENDKIVFQVRVSKRFFSGELHAFFSRLDSVYDFFEKNQLENRLLLYNLFGKDKVARTALDNWLFELGSYRGFRQDLDSVGFYRLQSWDSTLYQGKPQGLNPFHLSGTIIYSPVGLFIQNMLYKQFRAVIDQGEGQLHTIDTTYLLKPDFNRKTTKQEDCYWWISETLNASMLKRKICESCGPESGFTMIATDPLRSTVLEWYNKKFGEISKLMFPEKPGNLSENLEGLQRGAIATDSFLKEGSKTSIKSVGGKGSYKAGDTLYLAREYNLLSSAPEKSIKPPNGAKQAVATQDSTRFVPAGFISDMRALHLWLFNWLWYNKGYLVINPLPSYGPGRADSLKNAGDSITREMQKETQQKSFLDSALKHLKPELRKFETLKKIQDSADAVAGRIKKIQASLSAVYKINSADSLLAAAAIIDKNLYQGSLRINCPRCYLSATGDDVTRQFSYDGVGKSIAAVYGGQRQQRRVTEIPENEHLFIALNNIPQGAKINVSESLSSFDDLEEFTAIFQKLLKGLDSTGILGSALAPGLQSLTALLQSFKGRNSDSALDAVKKQAAVALAENDELTPTVAAYLEASIDKSPVRLTPGLTVPAAIPAKTDSAHGLITRLYPLADSTAPYQVNITLLVDSVKGKSTVKVGALHRFQLAGGFALVNKPVMQTSIDTTGNGFKAGASTNNAQAILGIKFYFAKTYLRDGEIIPRYPLRRISFMAAMSVPKVFSNFYLGLGYDIVPGLTVTAGENIYRQNYYQVQNGQIVNSATRYRGAGLYYGLTVNPVILTQFIKLFFTK